MMLLIGLFCLVSLACRLSSFNDSFGNMRRFNQKTALNDLDQEQVLLFLAANSTDMGFYWLDLENHTVYLAESWETNVLPSKDNITWTGTHLVYGARVQGFFALDMDGHVEQLTDYDSIGQIAKNGEVILRSKSCDPDETGWGYAITPLDQPPSPLIICKPRNNEQDPNVWYRLKAIWHPTLSQVDFIFSTRSGRGDDMVILSNQFIEVTTEGQLVEKEFFDSVFPGMLIDVIEPRPDGQAFFVQNYESGRGIIMSREGDILLDVAALAEQLPGLEWNGRFSWAPDNQKAAILFEDCSQGDSDCEDVLVLATNDFKELTPITTLPRQLRFNQIIWSPDSNNLGLVTEIHQGSDDLPRIYTVHLADQKMAEYIFPYRIILKHVEWLP